MSLACGFYLLRPDARVPGTWQAHLRSQINRGNAGAVAEFDDGRFFALKLDLGAFDAPGWKVGTRYVTALSGDAIFDVGLDQRDRTDDIAALAGAGLEDLHPLLAASRGYFNLVHYDRSDQRLALAVDRVGERSLYLYRDDDVVVFSGALRLIETLPGIHLTTDLQGVLETAAFGVPLGLRTRYKEVRCLGGGALRLFDGASEQLDRYWKFDRDACTEVTTDIEGTLDELYAQFQRAVALRAGRRKTVFSALSGGLDSRSVTTELWRRGLEVRALNVSWPGSQDAVLARLYAQRLGIDYHHVARPLDESGNSLSQRLCALLQEQASIGGIAPCAARQIWSGNGGSIGLGHVKARREVGALISSGDVAGAVRRLIAATKFNLSGKLLKGAVAGWAEALPFDSMMAEITQLRCQDPSRSVYVFLLEHDQRRLLAFHFEQIDLVPFEFIEPLFDPEVLRVVCRLPMEFCRYHRMYHQWLQRFPPEILSVAWQVYPGHEPCPVPPPADAFDQWKPPRHHGRAKACGDAVRGALRFLWQRRRYRDVLRADRVLGAYALQALQVRDTSHLLRQVDLLRVALSHSAARVHIPAAANHP